MRVIARAKINWTLDILSRRPDGYHEMDMLMQPISLSDEITLLPAGEITLTTSGTPLIPADSSNLAYRAAVALREHTGYRGGASIHVCKRIPAGAGLGGGSADAAGVLAGLSRLWGLGLAQEQLEAIGLTLGADIPFCLRGGLARVGGIGEKIVSISGGPSLPCVIIQPCEGLSTGDVFRAYHAMPDCRRPRTEQALHALVTGDCDALSASLGNVLEEVSRARRPGIAQAVDALRACGALCAQMSGSGSAVFGIFRDADAAAAAHRTLGARWERCHLCETCDKSIVMD